MNYALQFLLLVLVAALAGVKVTVQGQMSRRLIRGFADTLWFNVLMFAAIALMFVLIFPMGPINGTIIGFGVLLGCTTVLSQAFYGLAFNIGPVSLTVLIANFSVLINTLFSAVAFGEKLHLSQIIAIVCLAASMVLSRKPDKGGPKANTRWFVYSLLVMAGFGVGNSAQKFFWLTEASKAPHSDVTLLAVMYACASLIALLLYGVMAGKGNKSELRFQKPVIGFVLAIGASLCLFQKTSMYALAHVDGTFYFPTVSGLQSLWITAAGILLFKDKLSRNQKIGLVFGIISVALMNVRVGPAIQF